MTILQDALNYYREKKAEEKQKKKLINAKTDFHMLESLIQKCNENPALKVAVFMRDGTRIELKTWENSRKRDFELIDGNYMEVR